MLVLRKGYPNKLVTIINELVDNFISANGQQKSGYKSYFTEESLSLNIPFQNQTDSGVTYEASINFQFNLQYQYNNYKASFIDALVKFGTVLVFYFIIWGICCRIVKFMFYKELTNEILRADQQVQMSEGMLPQTKRQSLLRFSNELSFSKLYFNYNNERLYLVTEVKVVKQEKKMYFYCFISYQMQLENFSNNFQVQK